MDQTPEQERDQEGPQPLSDLERQRRQKEGKKIMAELDELMGQHHRMYRVAMAILMQTGAFSERDLQMMFRGQVLSSEFGPIPCDTWKVGDIKDPECIEPRRKSQLGYEGPLDPVPVPRHRMRCPLHDRGRKGDPLVPCKYAQEANPALAGQDVEEAPLLPADLPEPQRQAIHFFCRPQMEDLAPCKVLQALCQYDLSRDLQSPGGAFRVVAPAPPPPAVPPPEHGDDLGLRRLLGLRQAALEEQGRLDGAEDQQRRDVLRYLVQTGRLTNSDLVSMTYDLVMVTDTGWLPCRDDPQRFYWRPPGMEDDERDKEPDVPPQRYLCPLQVRGMLGDKTVPCVEAQRMVPVPEMIAKVRAHEEAAEKRRREYEAQGYPMRRPEPLPRSWATEEDAPGGPADLVQVLQVRPCHLLGRVAASALYPYGQLLQQAFTESAQAWLKENEEDRAERHAKKDAKKKDGQEPSGEST